MPPLRRLDSLILTLFALGLSIALSLLIAGAETRPIQALPTASPEIEAAYQRGLSEGRVKKINLVDWTCNGN